MYIFLKTEVSGEAGRVLWEGFFSEPPEFLCLCSRSSGREKCWKSARILELFPGRETVPCYFSSSDQGNRDNSEGSGEGPSCVTSPTDGGLQEAAERRA